LTNTPPVEARQRFLHPDSLPSLTELNPAVSARTGRAVLWALNLHPDQRPQTMEEFKEALLGSWNPTSLPLRPLPAPSLKDVFAAPRERALAVASLALVLVSLILTLSH
jgi:serine/threonine-protein kinase